jgi:hypothetical protein
VRLPLAAHSPLFCFLADGLRSAMMENENAPTLRNLYPDLSEDELKQADENLTQYLALVLRIFERLELDVETKIDAETEDGR